MDNILEWNACQKPSYVKGLKACKTALILAIFLKEREKIVSRKDSRYEITNRN